MVPDKLIERVSGRIAATVQRPSIPRPEPQPAPGSRPQASGASGAALALARTIDHTLLQPDAPPARIETLCQEALTYQFASVCINPIYVALAVRLLVGSGCPVGTVVGFPLGATTTAVKVFEARQAIDSGAREIDMVLAPGHLKASNFSAVFDDIVQVVAVCREEGGLCKVIIETALLNDEEKIAACLLAVRAGADFVKTSTGFAASGATVEDVALMRRVVGPTVGVKASGGVRTLDAARALLQAGATRIGTSAGVAIVGAAAQASAG